DRRSCSETAIPRSRAYPAARASTAHGLLPPLRLVRELLSRRRGARPPLSVGVRPKNATDKRRPLVVCHRSPPMTVGRWLHSRKGDDDVRLVGEVDAAAVARKADEAIDELSVIGSTADQLQNRINLVAVEPLIVCGSRRYQ